MDRKTIQWDACDMNFESKDRIVMKLMLYRVTSLLSNLGVDDDAMGIEMIGEEIFLWIGWYFFVLWEV